MSTGTCLAATLLLLAAAPARAADAPSRKLRPVPFTEVRLTDSFWAPRIETNRKKTVPHRDSTAGTPVDVTAIPYHAWDNREPGEMVVWIPETTAFAAPAPAPAPAGGAK